LLFRIAMPSAEHIARVAVSVIESRTDWSGHFAVVEDDHVRIKPLPSRR
jgi:hypothetical protein